MCRTYKAALSCGAQSHTVNITFNISGVSSCHFSVNGAQAPDLAQISSLAIKRIEVLRDGDSPQYGSDAIAG